LGARKGSSQLYSLDAAYTHSDALMFSAWVTHINTSSDQATVFGGGPATLTPTLAGIANIWTAALHNRSDALGLGADLKISDKLDVGGKFEFSQDLAEYRQRTEKGVVAVAQNLPDIKYQSTTFRLFGRYALQKNAGVRLDYVYDRRSISDWTWNSWQYVATTAADDGTTISQDSTQRVHFVGISAYYKWW
jgi:hypothetical protein